MKLNPIHAAAASVIVLAASTLAPQKAEAFEVGVSNLDVHDSTRFHGNTKTVSYGSTYEQEHYSQGYDTSKVLVDGRVDGHYYGGPGGGSGDIVADKFSVSTVGTWGHSSGFRSSTQHTRSYTSGRIDQRSTTSGHQVTAFTNF